MMENDVRLNSFLVLENFVFFKDRDQSRKMYGIGKSNF
ncbi:hypothetical protein LEP1GSC103_3033 [Leptospira borgpetersenii serovar Javanica str. UI 09931]|uniref:Uncharacterized protein n=4 Tax=Leptospira borgpetersenii TaxID=174 RepID=A0A0S2IRA9_LEPBO|nr:hypothetical protein LBBP_01910 [Leptospira borgpetersenii serovar Ballum]EKQ92024.1 hypothetical protein LEP1GSC101_3371 [Leptospira borgpetersenii str. UI 09149]EKR01839.1 hypothetical protein LEP1GSC121_3983 [Leptospira borgpetersenii serovar Castellonis str. 200801910]EMK08353.1 hypothetical protein LEP1GSC066_1269 [Leptospira sp. serovar Kenya str. Sh9]EMN12640.1 hypothetical protein LEP1GSC055_2478 [Leptospira borgpetersenii str. Brem 307]EMN18614.1 hypothetical protein LEP1GSC056_219